ncbi:unnamed protein product [Zymoseptoria tritici ST99CH_3D1]|uniref:ATPase of the ABC class n=1 Tax=Zymoseptoria tritici ST99CH_1E4 TaxID=1276532 RepID=A0A2H1GJ11_ZYMTR|nr:unnamed protein product [Zymoseptoria tritici ST99CH_1E4]SMR55928.1 unnamed protein product [Zymoseptoria tritici ST99CH_3D1]
MSGRGRGGGGRGAYYKARYGGGGRGRGSNAHNESSEQHASAPPQHSRQTKDWQQLESTLRSIDGAQYGAYKQLLGQYIHSNPRFTLSVDHVQGDAYAAPSRIRVIVPWKETGLPDHYLDSDIRRIALCDFVSRVAGTIIQTKHLDQSVSGTNGGWSGPKGGAFAFCRPGQEILPRTSAMISGNDSIELRLAVSLPAAGRTVLGQAAHKILSTNLTDLIQQSLFHGNLDQKKLAQHVQSAENQDSLRQQLSKMGLIALIANGSILPRASGASQAPMDSAQAIPFQSPKNLEVTITTAAGAVYTGMGIPRGVTLLTGGGFNGKSVLLEALERGVYNHIPGDGREAVVTDPSTVKITAEDGRSVSKTDISPFIAALPGGKDTKAFSTEDASGSTSMAANIQEALEVGCETLLIDEDSSATNLLVRDARMQALIRNEPITPLISKARALYTELGVSTVIVIGGLGDWLAVADRVILLDSYIPRDITSEAQRVVEQFPSEVVQDDHYGSIPRRQLKVDLSGLRTPFAARKTFIALSSQVKDAVDDPSRAESGVDLGGLEQIVEIGQTRTIAVLLQQVAALTEREALTMEEILQKLKQYVGVEETLPMDLVGGELVAVRRFEIAAALARIRGMALRVDVGQ